MSHPVTAPAHVRHTRRRFNQARWLFPLLERLLVPEYRALLKRLSLCPTASVLDLGTGTGAFAQAFVERGHRHVLGIDVADQLLRRARRRVPTARFYQADITELPDLPDRSFDIVTLGYVLHGMAPSLRLRTLQSAARLARRFVLVVDYQQRGNVVIRALEWAEGPHYPEFLRTGARHVLTLAGLNAWEHGPTRVDAGYWLCRPSSATQGHS